MSGDDVECVAGPQHGRNRRQALRAPRIAERGHGPRHLGEREQRVAAGLGRRTGVRRDTVRGHAQGAGRLAARDQRVLAVRPALAGLEAEAGVVTGEPGPVRELARPPLLVVDREQVEPSVCIGHLGEDPHHAERQRHPALHVDGARADQPPLGALERPVLGVRVDRVEVAEQQDLGRAGARQARHQVGRVAGGRAGDALDRGRARKQRRDHGAHLLRSVHVAGGRGDGDQRLELALGVLGDGGRGSRQPLAGELRPHR